MARDVGARGVEDVREVPAREVFLDELLAKLALHEGIRRNLPDESGRLLRGAVAFDREVEEALHEGHGERILAGARGEARAVELADGAVLHGDVGRIADDGVVLLPEDAVEGLDVLDLVVVLEFVAEDFLGVEGALRAGGEALARAEAPPVQEGIAGGDVDFEIVGIAQPGDAGDAQGGEEQAEAGDGDDVWVQVHAEDLIERVLGDDAGHFARQGFIPQGEEPRKAAEQEVAGAAGGIDHPHFAEAEGLDGRGEGAVEDELLDEDGGLEEGVAFARGFGEVLVEVAEEAGGVGERMRDEG